VAYLRPPVRIAGGFDTRIYAFQLAHVPPAFSGRLIVRIFREPDGGQRAAIEGALPNALADAGYLVPRVIDICTDAPVLGGAFILMHCIKGQTLLAAMARPAMLWRALRLLASAHARLHALDPLPILRAAEEAAVPSALAGTGGMLVRLQARTQGRGLEGLLPGFVRPARAFAPADARRVRTFASLGSRTPKTTACPACAQRRPSVPPTLPAPMTPISIMCSFPQAASCK